MGVAILPFGLYMRKREEKWLTERKLDKEKGIKKIAKEFKQYPKSTVAGCQGGGGQFIWI